MKKEYSVRILERLTLYNPHYIKMYFLRICILYNNFQNLKNNNLRSSILNKITINYFHDAKSCFFV